MNAAYDLNALGEELKLQGLDLVEDGAKKAFVAVHAWLKKSAQLSATPFDDVALSFLAGYEKLVLEKLDGIDGKVG